jgi:hypothetical protein
VPNRQYPLPANCDTVLTTISVAGGSHSRHGRFAFCKICCEQGTHAFHVSVTLSFDQTRAAAKHRKSMCRQSVLHRWRLSLRHDSATFDDVEAPSAIITKEHAWCDVTNRPFSDSLTNCTRLRWLASSAEHVNATSDLVKMALNNFTLVRRPTQPPSP